MPSETVACDCEPDLAGAAAYGRICDYCGTSSTSAHCIHDLSQDPCPECDVVPIAQLPAHHG